MEKIKTTPYDVVDHLRTTEEIEAYLAACRDEFKDDERLMAKALANIARAKERMAKDPISK